MPDAPLPEAALASLRKPNPAVMATVTATGRPVSVATWYLIEDDGLLMLCMNAGRARLKHLRNHGHVSLTASVSRDHGRGSSCTQLTGKDVRPSSTPREP